MGLQLLWDLELGLGIGKRLYGGLKLEKRCMYLLLLQLLGEEVERILQELVLQLLLAIVGQPVVGA